MLSMADSVYADANLDRDGAELHIRHDSPIRHGEGERQEGVQGGDAAALVPVHHEYLPSIPPLWQHAPVEYIHKDISTYIHLI